MRKHLPVGISININEYVYIINQNLQHKSPNILKKEGDTAIGRCKAFRELPPSIQNLPNTYLCRYNKGLKIVQICTKSLYTPQDNGRALALASLTPVWFHICTQDRSKQRPCSWNFVACLSTIVLIKYEWCSKQVVYGSLKTCTTERYLIISIVSFIISSHRRWIAESPRSSILRVRPSYRSSINKEQQQTTCNHHVCNLELSLRFLVSILYTILPALLWISTLYYHYYRSDSNQ